ncbi:hypothetical protein VOLCADRAFT_101407, partial [Volvox carteri f. nagariensis]
MFDGVLGVSEAAPRTNVEAFRADTHEFNMTTSLLARPGYENPMRGSALGVDAVDSWWSPEGNIPGSVTIQGSHGVAESTNRRPTAFTQISSSVARELYASAPSLTAMPNQPLSAQTSTAVPASGVPSPGVRVQFTNAVVLDTIPGEVPATPVGHPRLPFEPNSRSLAPPGAISSRLQTPPSPDRHTRFTTEAFALKNFHSTRQQAQSARRAGALFHLAPLELPQDISRLRLEITLQHSNSIEKVSAAELLPFQVGEAPFVSGVSSRTRRLLAEGRSYRLFVLFPSLMRPPLWLRRDFSPVKKATVEVDWKLSHRTQFLLYCLRRLRQAECQSLGVWASKRRFGAGEAFALYGAEGRAELTDLSYVLLF